MRWGYDRGRAAGRTPAPGARARSAVEPEDRHRLCWYSRRTPEIPEQLSVHTVVDGQLLYCAHPMQFPVVGLDFDVRNCVGCDCFRPIARSGPARSSSV
jgi:hypothetical protein